MNLLKSYNYIKNNLELINNINVFPVYDKDTGNNVLYTLENVKNIGINKENLPIISEKILYNARGNSGNILSLFFLGLSQNKDKDLYNMCKNASDFVWENMYNPQHGTILDAISDVPDNLDLETFLLNYYNNSVAELLIGKNKLKVLDEYNTVDAGTLCLVYILKGLYESVSDKPIDFSLDIPLIKNKPNKSKYKFCINFTIDNVNCNIPCNGFDIDNFIETSSNDVHRIHVHADAYKSILDFYSKYGNISNIYIQSINQ